MDEKLKFKAAAELIGVPVNTLYSMVYRKQIPHLRYGPRSVRFSREALEKWITESVVTPIDKKIGDRK